MSSTPLNPWSKGQPVSHQRLNAFEQQAVTEVRVGPGLTMTRVGGSVTIGTIRDSNPIMTGQVPFKISSIVTSQIGRYNAKRFTLTPNAGATGNLAEANIGTLATADDAVVWHVPEIALGASKHVLKTGVTYMGRPAGINSDGKAIIMVGVLPIGETASPTTLGSAAEGSETASTMSWARTSGTPLDLYLTTRVGYYDAGDETLYGYAVKLSFDAFGALIAVSGETRYGIDVPEDCDA
jgi:hypothetical protein